MLLLLIGKWHGGWWFSEGAVCVGACLTCGPWKTRPEYVGMVYRPFTTWTLKTAEMKLKLP